MDEWKTNRGSSQIPAFGNWDYVNDLPITQYFECARQAGLIRYSSSSGEYDVPHSAGTGADLYSVADNYQKPRSNQGKGKGKGREKRGGGVVAQGNHQNYNYSYDKGEGNINSKKQGAGKVYNVTVTELPYPPSSAPTVTGKRHPASAGANVNVKKQQQQFRYDVGSAASLSHPHQRPPKAVDEDLYKIPPELLKRKRRLGFISRCLVPPCAV